ncbi:hypothetical protein [Corticicoccus populi]|uniref:DUF4145 domain-containing protein n=1 Tax=Corticicoccus populi TaxID=1812821 RepID=A0ABW5WW78_9STAP
MGNRIEDNESIRLIKSLKDDLNNSRTVYPNHKVDEITENIETLSLIPDKYNEIFLSSGWIAHETLDIEIMNKAINIYNEENLSRAEEYILSMYRKKIKTNLKIVIAQSPIFSRKRLIYLAQEDYNNKRYHSCIPVILMLLDGIVDDIKNSGLYSTNTDLEIEDSITGHKRGLKKLIELITSATQKTNVNSISIPYRNRILHGRELSYDNEIVAVKTFALLFYVSDWIRSLRNEEQRKKDSIAMNNLTIPTRQDIVAHDDKKREDLFKQWKPRERIHLENPDLNTHNTTTPEGTVLAFFKYIQEKNYGTPGKFYFKEIYGDVSSGQQAGVLKIPWENKEIIGVRNLVCTDTGPSKSDITVQVEYKVNGCKKTKEISVWTIYELEGYAPNRILEGGIWTIPRIESIGWELD